MAETLTIECLKPGGGAFIVDKGRPGYQHLGLASGGPADARAMAEANRLLGREQRATCLELTQTGGQWLLSGSGQFALTGADMNWRINGRLVELYQVQYLAGDSLLTSTAAMQGLRSYLAVNGNWKLKNVLGSSEAGLPDTLAVTSGWSTAVEWEAEAGFRMDLDVYQHTTQSPYLLSVIPGPEWPLLDKATKDWLLATDLVVHPDSNRQGTRLLPATATPASFPPMISSPVLPGTIQLAPSGPIVLGPDAQTIGGYPRVLVAANRDVLSALFQAGIGTTVRFQIV